MGIKIKQFAAVCGRQVSSGSAFRSVGYFSVMHLDYGKVATLFEVQSGSTLSLQKLHGLAVKKVLCRSLVADVCQVKRPRIVRDPAFDA
jgi:hypothetical protein